MAKTKFKIRTKIVFSGQVEVEASNFLNAGVIVENALTAQLGEISSNNPKIKAWDFDGIGYAFEEGEV